MDAICWRSCVRAPRSLPSARRVICFLSSSARCGASARHGHCRIATSSSRMSLSVVADNVVKLCDFGFARRVMSRPNIPHGDAVRLAQLSRARARQAARVHARCRRVGLWRGALHVMLSGSPPFHARAPRPRSCDSLRVARFSSTPMSGAPISDAAKRLVSVTPHCRCARARHTNRRRVGS
jgi:hypothetical protein